MTEHYLEVHVNVDPDDGVYEVADAVAKHLGFRRGKLLMDKGFPAPDAFYTWRGSDVSTAEMATRAFVKWLNDHGLHVLRYKLELTLVDSRESDRWGLL